MQGIGERTRQEAEIYNRIMDGIGFNMRVCCPGIIQSFDSTSQTVTVKCAVRERVNIEGNLTWTEIPLLVDVPIVIPRAGGYMVTFPITAGDECLVVFADSCIDAWYQSGGIQNQIDRRRHDLSDAFAIIGTWSQPKKISNYSNNTVQIRNEAKTAYVEIDGTTINIVTSGNANINCNSSVNINANSAANVTAPQVTVNASTECTINSNQVGLSGAWSGMRRLIDERFLTLFNNHQHQYDYGYGGVATSAPYTPLVLNDHATNKTRAT
jgi:hypothetical protein